MQLGRALAVLRLLAGVVLLASGSPVIGQQAGTVQQAVGRSLAASPTGDFRLLARGDDVNSGEVISTGPGSFLRLNFRDGTNMVLRPSTRFQIEDYRHTGDPARVGEERGFFSLLKGGFRAVTGIIGRVNRRNFRVTTRLATIGIRGTDFGVVDLPNGVHVAVYDNSGLDISGPGGEASAGPGAGVRVDNDGVPTVGATPPPEIVEMSGYNPTGECQ